MSDIPPFHPDWLVSFWLGTPILNKLNPHVILIFLITLLLIGLLRRRKLMQKQEPDSDEKQFQLLLKKKAVIEEQMTRLEVQKKQGEVTEEQYAKTIAEYKQHLDGVKRELLKFT